MRREDRRVRICNEVKNRGKERLEGEGIREE
jgi:hypothetical protein